MHSSSLISLCLAASAAVVSAQIEIVNSYVSLDPKMSITLNFLSCPFDVYIYQSTDGGCDYGESSFDACSSNPSECFGDSDLCFTDPWVVADGGDISIPWIEDGLGTSMKIATNPDFDSVVQFEYTWSDGIYWDLSLLNGGVDGSVGTPFAGYSIVVGPGENEGGTCEAITCLPDLCEGAYINPDDDDTDVSA